MLLVNPWRICVVGVVLYAGKKGNGERRDVSSTKLTSANKLLSTCFFVLAFKMLDPAPCHVTCLALHRVSHVSEGDLPLPATGKHTLKHDMTPPKQDNACTRNVLCLSLPGMDSPCAKQFPSICSKFIYLLNLL